MSDNYFQYTVSVIIPVYNAEKYLPDAIESLIQQSLSPNEVEILLIDDGSTDKSAVICDMYASRLQNVRVIHQSNKGISAARNRGIAAANGKYLTYLDADDWISMDTLKIVTNFFDQHYNEIDVVGFTTVLVFSKEKKKNPRENRVKTSGIIACNNDNFINLTRLSVVVKNQGKDNVLFSEKIKFHEDEDYLIRIVAKHACFGYVKEACYYYRQNTGGVTDTIFADRLFEPTMYMYSEWMEEYKTDKELYPYVQNTILNDFGWKMRTDKLFPKDLSSSKYSRSLMLFLDLLNLIGYERLLQHPNLDHQDRFFLLAHKNAHEQEKRADIKECILLITGHSKDTRKQTMSEMGMLLAMGLEQDELNIRLKNNKYSAPVSSTIYEYRDHNSNILSLNVLGFCGDNSWNRGNTAEIEVQYKGKNVPTNVLVRQDVMVNESVDVRSRGLKATLLTIVSKILKPILSPVWLYQGCLGTFYNECRKMDGIRRYYVLQEGEQALEDIKKTNQVSFGSRRHRLLFLLTDGIVLSAPWQRYIPIYEKTYKKLARSLNYVLKIMPERNERKGKTASQPTKAAEFYNSTMRGK